MDLGLFQAWLSSAVKLDSRIHKHPVHCLVDVYAAKLHLLPILQLAETAESFILPTKPCQLNAQSENFLGNTHVNVRTAHTSSPPAILRLLATLHPEHGILSISNRADNHAIPPATIDEP